MFLFASAEVGTTTCNPRDALVLCRILLMEALYNMSELDERNLFEMANKRLGKNSRHSEQQTAYQNGELALRSFITALKIDINRGPLR